MKTKKILVLGATGFIGRHLTQSLLKRNLEVITFARSHLDISGIRHISGDIRNCDILKKLINYKPDIIYLLSGLSGQTNTDRDPDLSYSVNVKGPMHLLDLVIRKIPETKVIISSSRLEYGKARYLPVDEDHPVFPTSIYGFHKNIITQYCKLLRNKYGLNYTVLRTSNPYGYDKNSHKMKYNIINQFIKSSLSDQKLVIYGTGRQKRDYLYIDDFIELLVLLVKPTIGMAQIYNVGMGEGISILSAANQIIKLVKKGKIEHHPWPDVVEKVETGDYVSDITKITTELHWKPTTSFKEGIQKTLAWY